jgi:putative DNA primase/helicase
MTGARDLAARLGLRRSAGGWTGRCPACGYKTGLRLSEKGGRALWWCASCQDQAAVTAAITGEASPAAPAAPEPGAEALDRQAAALRLWDAALPRQGTPVDYYLARRLPGADLAPLRDVAFLPQAKHPGGSRHLCMVALLRDQAGRPVAVHRTFLAPGGAGKAQLDPAKMTLGPVRGAAVRLHAAADRLVIGEGIESALAAGHLLRIPAWAAVSAGNLRDSLALPPAVREVTIAADHDPPGLAAAQAAAARWKAEGRAVRIAKPEKPRADFADLLVERARRGG